MLAPIIKYIFVSSCSAAACNVAVRILSPKFERLSYRYSKALYADTYQSKLITG